VDALDALSPPMTIRRNTITHEDAIAMLIVMAFAAVSAAFAGCRPTGGRITDPLLAAALAAFVVWAAASAPWWMLVAAGGCAALASGSLLGAALGLVAAAGAMWVGSRRESRVAVRCASAALTVQVLLRLDLGWFFGASALLAGLVTAALVVLGVQRRQRPVRRRVVIGSLVFVGVAAAATAGLGVGAVQARSDLQSGYNGLLEGLDLLQSGRADEAAVVLHDSADRLASASDQLDQLWTLPSQAVPIVAQHGTLLNEVVAGAAASAAAAADALDVVDLDLLTINDGVVDVNAVAILALPLSELANAVGDLEATLDQADSPWLVSSVQDRLGRYRGRAEQVAAQANAAAEAANTGPAMLGADGQRRYLMMFTSPAESRGLTGLMGNYAVVTMTNGQIRRTEFGRTNTLINTIVANPDIELDAPAEYFARYGAYGAGDQGGSPRPKFWSNVTMSPDMPTVGNIVAQLYEGGGGAALDGVFVLDPAGLAAVLDVAGPIQLDGLETPLDGSNLAQFLLRDIYVFDEDVRENLLQQASERTVDALLTGSLPAPQEIAGKLGAATTTGHIVAWARRPEEQNVFRLMGMDGALPPLAGRDGLAVVNNNGSGNKIDSFLNRTVTYRAEYDASSGRVDATMEVTLRNDAPATGYPDYVIGNLLGLPPGSNRTLLSVYSPLTLSAIALDGETSAASNQTELGWNVYSVFVVVPPGGERTITLTLTGLIDEGDYALVVRPQPLPNPDQYVIEVGGDADVSYDGPITRRTVVDGQGTRALR